MFFSKTYPSFLTLKEGSTFLTKPLFPQGREDVTALQCSEPLRYKVGGASKPSSWLCGMGPPGERWLKVKVWGISLGGFGAIGADVIIGYPIFPSFLLL